MSNSNEHSSEISDQNEALRRENADLYAQIKALSHRLAQGSAGGCLTRGVPALLCFAHARRCPHQRRGAGICFCLKCPGRIMSALRWRVGNRGACCGRPPVHITPGRAV
jgi:hypothetical protein